MYFVTALCRPMAEADDIGVEVIIERILDAVDQPKELFGPTPEELRELRRIHVLAGRRVDSLLAGDYRSAVRGRGMELKRCVSTSRAMTSAYYWNVTARAGEPFVKVFREERQMTVQLVVDISPARRGWDRADAMALRIADVRLRVLQVALPMRAFETEIVWG